MAKLTPVHVKAAQDPDDPGYVTAACGFRVREGAAVTREEWTAIEGRPRCRKKGCVLAGTTGRTNDRQNRGKYRPRNAVPSQRISLTLDAGVIEQLYRIADQQKCSISAFVDLALREFLDARQRGTT